MRFIAACAITLALAACAAGADNLLVERRLRLTAREVSLDLERRRAHAEGDAVLTYDAQDIEFRADTIDADLEAQSIAASGNICVLQASNCLFAHTLQYDVDDRTGLLTEARGQALGLHFAAASLRATPRQMVLSRGSFTTCDLDHPHYRVSADEIVLRPDDRAIARRAALWYGDRRLLRLPNWSISTREKRPAAPLTPIGGFSRRDGAFAGAHYRLISSLTSGADLELRYTTARNLRAYAQAEMRPRWGRAALTFSRRQDLTQPDLGLFAPYTPVRDLTLDRLPEVVVETNAVPLGNWGDVSARVAAGRYLEFPSRVRAARAAADLSLQGRAISLGRGVSLRPVLGVRGAWYDTNQDRTAVAYGVKVETQPGADLALRIGYFQRTASGEGPFFFDAIDISREVGCGLAARLGPRWRTEVLARYDLDRAQFPALDVAVIRVAHCLEYGVVWRKVGGEFGLRLGLTQAGPVAAPAW